MPNDREPRSHSLGKPAAELMPDQPWGDIRGMGNRLRQAYDRINLDVIWNASASMWQV